MTAPRSMMAHTLNPLKGWPHNAALDFSAPLSATALASAPIFSGSCVHLTTNTAVVGNVEYDLGCPKTSGKWHMPLFLFPNSDDPDVSNDGGIYGTSDDAPEGWAAVKRNNVLALVATGAYELETTEFDDDDYAAGDALRSGTDGKLENGVQYTDPIVGIVSRGVKNLGQLTTTGGAPVRSALAFWPVNLPATP